MQDLCLPWSSCSSSFLPIQIDTNGQHTTAHGQGQRSKCSSFLRPEDILDVTAGRLSAWGCLLNPATSKKKTLCGQNSLKSEHSQHSAIGSWQSCCRVSYAQPTRMKKRNCMAKVVAWAGAAGSKSQAQRLWNLSNMNTQSSASHRAPQEYMGSDQNSFIRERPFFANKNVTFAKLSRTPCLSFAGSIQQHLLWRFVHHLPNYARESRITSW